MVQLFDRHHTPIQLTPNGQLYIDKMRLILSDEEHLKEELRLRKKMIETVSIGIGHLHSNMICPSLIELLSEKYPNLNISILIRTGFCQSNNIYTQVFFFHG